MEPIASQKATADIAEAPEPTADTTLRGRWLFAARVAWVAIAVLAVGLFIAALPYDFRELQRVCTGDDCQSDVQLTPEDAEALEDMGLSLAFYARYFLALVILLVIAFTLIPALIFWRRSDDWMAMFVSLTLVLFGTSLPNVMELLEEAQPAVELLVDFVFYLAFISIPLLFLLFPDGRFVPRWTRFIGLGVILAALISFTAFIVPQGGGDPANDPFLNTVFTVGLAIGVFAQIYRYRRVSDPVSRQQVKWVVFAVIGLVLAIIVGVIVEETASPGRPRVLAYLIGTPLFFVVPSILVPLAIAFSILRYRLWDIPVFVNRALVYGSLTATLGGVYVGIVVGLQVAFREVTDQSSVVAVAISTLVIAALFQPVRRRAQGFIDRRLYRRRYDAVQTLAAFGATARDEVDLERLTGELVAVVENTMQPAHVSLWLRDPERNA